MPSCYHAKRFHENVGMNDLGEKAMGLPNSQVPYFADTRSKTTP
jgi:hypothetical protein